MHVTSSHVMLRNAAPCCSVMNQSINQSIKSINQSIFVFNITKETTADTAATGISSHVKCYQERPEEGKQLGHLNSGFLAHFTTCSYYLRGTTSTLIIIIIILVFN